MSATTYIKRVIDKYETTLNRILRPKKTPMEDKYHPETDESELLSPDRISMYRGLIGSANWIITLGRCDIYYADNTLSRFSMAPREGHYEAMIRVFGYLKCCPNGQILIDPHPAEALTTEEKILDRSWTECYPDAEEDIPPDMPEPLGKPATTACYVDADHAHDLVTRRSVTGILMLMNNMPVKWYSKRQKTVETSSYGSELVAARIAVETIIELRYKLRMLGIPIEGPTRMYGDNMAVVLNTSVPSSQLKKKHNAIAYHRVRESIAAGFVTFQHISTKVNLADCLTKPLTADQFQRSVQPMLFRHTETMYSLRKHDELPPPTLNDQNDQYEAKTTTPPRLPYDHVPPEPFADA
jgi:hypothetical protein